MPNMEAFLVNSDPKQIAFRPLLREFNTSSTQAFLVCLDNNRIRKVIDNFELLVDDAVTDNARAIKYATCIPNYRDGMIIL
jgi:hypothetical protein